jgi:hypothetical protein
MMLGAAGVLSTLWQVDDRATMPLMAKFYELHRLSGESLIATEPGRNRIVQSLSQTSFKRLLQQNLPVADSA